MNTTITLAEVIQFTRTREQQLVGLQLPNKPRLRVAYACFSIAREHHSSILLLLQQNPPFHATAFALLRPTLEAALRGEWIAECATDDQVKTFAIGGKKQLDMASVIKALEAQSGAANMHKALYKDLWPIISAYTHTFEHQLQHWLEEDSPIPNYTPEQTSWLLNNSTACLALCVSSTERLATAK